MSADSDLKYLPRIRICIPIWTSYSSPPSPLLPHAPHLSPLLHLPSSLTPIPLLPSSRLPYTLHLISPPSSLNSPPLPLILPHPLPLIPNPSSLPLSSNPSSHVTRLSSHVTRLSFLPIPKSNVFVFVNYIIVTGKITYNKQVVQYFGEKKLKILLIFSCFTN